MSRIGKAPIALPAKVEVSVSKGNLVTVKGPKGSLSRQIDPDITLRQEDGTLHVERPTEQKRHKALHGLYRALVYNMVHGVSEGFVRELEVVGVGFRAANTGQMLELTIGFSHPILFELPAEVKLTTVTEKGSAPLVKLESIDKELVGLIAAKIRSLRKPEPYKGKGIKYKEEILRRKAGKTAGKGGKK
ncbi:MAG: 50S ribosomal protein L6 [Saprospiraceae bacterium]